MARPLRLDHAGAIWHVTSRGNERREVFREDADRLTFLSVLAEVVRLDRWRIYAYVLMTNHYHLLIETPLPTLSKGMHRLNGTYTQRYNQRYQRVGHLFQGRYTSILVERESHLLTLIRYVVLNPVRAGIARRAADWRWSSFGATAGTIACPEWLDRHWILSQFGHAPHASKRYRRFVEAAGAHEDRPWSELEGQVFLGREGFRARAQSLVDNGRESQDVPCMQRHPMRPGLELIARSACSEFRCSPRQLRSRKESDVRLAVALLARCDALAPARGYASILGVGPSGASRLAKTGAALVVSSRVFQSRIDRIRATIRADFENGDLTPVSKMET